MENRSQHKGQALVMVTLALLAMCGLMGLAVDLGWSYYVQKNAQKAADSAALSAAKYALNSVPPAVLNDRNWYQTNLVNHPGSPQTPCTGITAAHLSFGCLIARQNGFDYTTNQRQMVYVRDGTGKPLGWPENWRLPSFYRVTVYTVEQVPQLFSAVLGNGLATVSARATAVITDSIVVGSLWLINRESDTLPLRGNGGFVAGQNTNLDGNSSITARAGIYLASTAEGAGQCNDFDYANCVDGAAQVTAPWTRLLSDGGAINTKFSNISNWNSPITQEGDGDMFMDPLRRKPSPPLPSMDNNWNSGVYKALGNRIVGPDYDSNGECTNGYLTINNKHVIGTSLDANGVQVPNFQVVEIAECVQFTGSSVIWGGLRGQGINVKFGEGIYVFAGALPDRQGNASDLFSNQGSSQLFITDEQAGRYDPYDPSDTMNRRGGELFVFTDGNYRDLETTAPAEIRNSPIFPLLKQGRAGFQAGNAPSDKIKIDLTGYDDRYNTTAPELPDHRGILFWQDRRNSYVDIAGDGLTTGDVACGNSAPGCPNSDANDNVIGDSPRLWFQASPTANYRGVIYQTRGAFTTMVGGGTYSGALQIITGAIDLQGGSDLELLPFSLPFTKRTVALVE